MKLIELRSPVCGACDMQGKILQNFHEIPHEVLDITKSDRAKRLAQVCELQTTPVLLFVEAEDRVVYAEPGYHDLRAVLKMYETAKKLC